MRLIGRGMLVAAAVLVASPAIAEEFPQHRPVEMTVMFGAGSAADVTARYLAGGMATNLGVAVPAVNRTGAGGVVGYKHVEQPRPINARLQDAIKRTVESPEFAAAGKSIGFTPAYLRRGRISAGSSRATT